MNNGEGWSSGGRRGPRGRSNSKETWQIVNRPKSESPVTVDRSLDESSGNRSSRGSRGRGRCRTVQVYVEKSSQVSNVGKAAQEEVKSQEDGLGSTKQPDEGAAFKCSGDNSDLLQPSASPVSRECEGRMSFGLANRMEDVSLCGQVSMSSTSDKKVEDRNAWNESNTRVFDICLEKKVFCLKSSILELNREKRRATKGYPGIVIRPGMVLLKNYLSINDQVMIVNKCRELGLGEGGFYQPGYGDGALLHLKMMCLGRNWDPQTSRYGDTRPHDGSVPPKIPFEFNQFVQKAIQDSQSLVATSSKKTKGEDEIPCMSPDICIANFYTSTGRLGLHKDKDESANSIQKGLPVVSFSIGDSAEFVYGDQRDYDKAEMEVLESGDVLLFGGKSRNIFHGVRSILKDTAPKVLVQETNLRPGRLNLTFRQY
ncbi:BnaC05g52110D [Brassica napus]|uniref:DNA N(6)-methyladenine demethylase n=1 Tax=Brassica napus TaxID=3708 RepID=A0A078IQQ7_BRANA|nr:BnaC05g52110D [Brassica napus]